MQTPFELLNVALNADDTEIRQAYLQLIKDHPPEKNPERFQLIRSAYESIKDERSRMRYALFNVPAVDFDALLDRALEPAQPPRIDLEQFIELLRAGIDDTTLLNAMADSESS